MGPAELQGQYYLMLAVGDGFCLVVSSISSGSILAKKLLSRQLALKIFFVSAHWPNNRGKNLMANAATKDFIIAALEL